MLMSPAEQAEDISRGTSCSPRHHPIICEGGFIIKANEAFSP